MLKMSEPSYSFLDVWFGVEILFAFINKFTSFIMMILAFIVSYNYFNCNREMSILLLFSGLLTLGMFLSIAGVTRRLLNPHLIGIGIFGIAWNIYAAVLFLPVVGGPHPVCNDDKDMDGKVLVISGTIILAFRVFFCLIPAMLHTLVWWPRRSKLSYFLVTYAFLT